MSDPASHSLAWTSELLHPHDDPGKRRTALLQAAFDTVAETGFEGLRTRIVAERAGVNIATLHYYFPSKQDLIEGLARLIGAKFVSLHGPSALPSGFPALDRLRQEFSDVRFYLYQHPEMLLVMQEFVLRGKRDPEVQKVVDQMNFYWHSGIERMVLRGVADGVFRADIDPAVLVALLMAIFLGIPEISSDLIDSIQRTTESWVLSDTVKQRLTESQGAKA